MTRITAEQAQERDELIVAAIRDRKIAAHRAKDYARMFDADPAGIRRLLTAPVRVGGLMAGVVSASEQPAPPTDYPAEWVAGSRPAGRVGFEDASSSADAAASTLPGGVVIEP